MSTINSSSSSSSDGNSKFTSLPVEAPSSDDNVCYSINDFPSLELFTETILYPAISVPKQQTATIRKILQKANILLTKIKNIYSDNNNNIERRIIVLIQDTTVETIRTIIQQKDQGHDDIEYTTYEIIKTYEQYTTDEILRKLLPISIDNEIPSSFELIGHIAHVNLRSIWLPYKYWIGKVILDKHSPPISIVVNKLNTVNTQYRTFHMEIIASSKNYNYKNNNNDWSITTVIEHGYYYQLDYQNVYWNSRLSGEHHRLVQYIRKKHNNNGNNNKNIVVADCMAGVGPFVIPLAILPNDNSDNNNIIVHANDLNPESYKYLNINIKKNINKHYNKKKNNNNNNTNINNNIITYNMDGVKFIKDVLMTKLQCSNNIHHIILNLPASAPEFLYAFRGWNNNNNNNNNNNTYPMIHVYCFANKKSLLNDDDEKKDPNQLAIERCERSLGCSITKDNNNEVNVHTVRDVSPGKNMLCISFRLPTAVSDLLPVDKVDDEPTTTTTIDNNNNKAILEEQITANKKQKVQ